MAVPPLGPGTSSEEPARPTGHLPDDPVVVTVIWTWSEPLEEWVGIVDAVPAKITCRIWTNDIGLAEWEITNGEANQFRRGTTYRTGISATIDEAKATIGEVVQMRWPQWEVKPKPEEPPV